MGRNDNGNGSIYKISDNKWVAQIQIGKKPNGKPEIKQFSAKTESEVKRKLKYFKKERGKYISGNTGNKTILSDYIINWLKTYKIKQLSSPSYDRLESTIKNHIIPELGNLQFGSVTQDDIQKLINKKEKDGFSFSSIKKIYLAINACYKHACQLPPSIRLIDYNPAANVMLPRSNSSSKKEIRFYTEDEIKRIKEVINSKYKNGNVRYPYGGAYILILNTGMRLGEALALTRSEIDLDSAKIYINKNIILIKDRDEDGEVTHKYNLEVKDGVKTYSSQRWITLNDTALEAIKNLRSYKASGDFLIANKYGNRVTPQAFERQFEYILKQAKVNNAGVHALRHTFATLLFKNGVDVKIVSKILGHSSVKITYDIYIHVIEEQEQNAVNLIPNI